MDDAPAKVNSRAPARATLLIALLAVAVAPWTTPIRWESDTQQLYDGLANLIAWWDGGRTGHADAGPFPPFQYVTGLPVVLLNRAGVPINIFWFWATCSLLSFAGVAWLLCRAGRTHGSRATGWLLVALLLSGPLVTYAPSTFNELPAAFVTALFAATVVGRGGAVICAALFVVAGSTKEIATPLLALIWLAGVALRRDELGSRDVARHFAAALVAAVVTIALHVAFNEIRYGSPWNEHYLAPQHLTRAWTRRLQNVAALWFAPNGGVVPFWPTLAGAAAALAVARTPTVVRRGSRVALISLAGLLATLTLGLAAFHQPFGWWCWGPRLMLPWLPACVIVLIRARPEAARRITRGLLSGRRMFAMTTAIVCLCAVPHLAMLANPPAMSRFFEPDPQFPLGAPPAEMEMHYARQVFLAWQKRPPLLVRPMLDRPTLGQVVAAIAYLTGVIGLLRHARQLEFAPKSDPQAVSG